MSKIIRREIDLQNPPPFTAEELAEIKALQKMPDSEINFSDITPLDDNFFKNAIRSPYYKPTKTSKTLRIDSDVLEWFKRKGKGYQTKINAALRDAMIRELQHQTS